MDTAPGSQPARGTNGTPAGHGVMFAPLREVYRDRGSSRTQPLKSRRKALEKLLTKQTLILLARRRMRNGLAAWAEVLHRGWEKWLRRTRSRPMSPGPRSNG
jgi:hypothetical protein